MLKKLSKRIEMELKQAADYVEQAFLVKHKSSTTSDLFISLGTEELDHAEKLLKEGQRLLQDYAENTEFLDESAKEHSTHDKCKVIWEWETRLAMDKVLELKYKIYQYKNMR